MTPCARYPDDDLLTRYVAGTLTEPDLSAFEDHLFACDTCLDRVERYQAARQALVARELPALPTVVPVAAAGSASAVTRQTWWVLGAVAALVLAGLGALLVWQGIEAPAPQVAHAPPAVAPAPAARRPLVARTPADGPTSASLQLAVLAMVSPPPYLPMVTRGDGRESDRFSTGMAAYVRSDWPAAARALGDVDTPQGRFYRGIAELMRGETTAAVTALESARASGVQPYARESLFYLGKAALQRGDVATAREWFSTARDAGAGPDREATRLLTALDEMLDPSEGRR